MLKVSTRSGKPIRFAAALLAAWATACLTGQAFAAEPGQTAGLGDQRMAQRAFSPTGESASSATSDSLTERGTIEGNVLEFDATLTEDIEAPPAWCEPPSHYHGVGPDTSSESPRPIELPPSFQYAVQRNYGSLPSPYHPVGYTYARPWGGWGYPPYGNWGIYGFRGLYPRPWGYWRYSYPTYYGFYRPWYPYAPYSPYAYYYRYPRYYTAPWYAYHGPGVYEYSPARAYYNDSYAGCYYW